jgi:UDP-3-O-[3-hydroxymyristoyl] glucosamine N-acyltransferase
VFAGQVGVAGHLKIADRTTLGAQCGINANVKKEDEVLLGSPGIYYRDYFRSYAVFRRLPEIKKQVDEMNRSTANG